MGDIEVRISDGTSVEVHRDGAWHSLPRCRTPNHADATRLHIQAIIIAAVQAERGLWAGQYRLVRQMRTFSPHQIKVLDDAFAILATKEAGDE